MAQQVPEQAAQACLYRQFQARAARHPERPAVIAPDGMRTYAELDADVTHLAAGLVSRGIRAGDRLGLLLDRGADAVTALLASIRLGATFIALDPAFPVARLSAILDDSRPKLVLHHEEHAPVLGSWDGQPLSFAQACQPGGGQAAASTVAAGEDPMYIIYTSGSTGVPKGIVQTYQTIRNLVRWENEETGIQFTGRVLQNSSLAFDVSLQEILSALVMGGSLVVSSAFDKLDPDLMIRLLRQQRLNVVFFSVSTLTQLFARPDRLAALPGTLTDIVTAGEQLYINDALREYLLARPRLRLHNHYGVSESHVVTAATISGEAGDIPVKAPIGKPVAGSRVFLRNAEGQPVSPGDTGEVVIAGQCLALGYLNRPDEQRKRFVTVDGERRYLTGDLAFERTDGQLEFVGRADQQLKIRGHLVEPGDVEAALRRHPAVTDAVVDATTGDGGERQLAAWYLSTASCSEADLRAQLAEQLPSFMIPSRFQRLDALPVGPTGKVDRDTLRSLLHGGQQLAEAGVVPASAGPPGPAGSAARVLDILRRALDRPDLDPRTAFFEVGATSLTLAHAAEVLSQELAGKVGAIDLFRFPCSAELAAELDRRTGAVQEKSGAAPLPAVERQVDEAIAVVGMAGRFPGASDVHALWRMLAAGRHGLVPQPDPPSQSWWVPELPASDGPAPLVGLIDDAYRFDAGFFGYSKRAAQWLDPQHRLLLMCAYAALESAGYPPLQGGRVGVYAGSEFPGYIASVRPHVRSMDDYLQSLIGNDKDFLATRVAHKLNLTGPAITVQTACSTSLVAVHLARQALLLGECDLALAGGVSLVFPQEFGHHHQEGLIYSPDGLTRPFDADGEGTNMTSGVGMVALKRLSSAITDGDPILAIVRGSAINNDGASKVGYTAPSVSGQARVMRDALASARLTPADIDFVEAHGTATPLGDAVELAALNEVFADTGEKKILLGSIKGNIGHANRASGVAGLIKAVLALHHGELPPTVGHRRPASEAGLCDGPFTVAVSPTPLRTTGPPSRAGVSSFGFGGTNAHVVVEQWQPPAPAASEDPQLLTLTADSRDQLSVLAAELASYLDATPEITVADAAYTRNTGRDRRPLVLPVVASRREELVDRLREAAADPPPEPQPARAASVIFLLPGGGRANLLAGARLYQRYAGFRDRANEILDELEPPSRSVLQNWLADPASHSDAVVGRLELLQPLVFLLSRATALLLMDWGLTPSALIGSSQGELTAASIAGAIGVRDATLLAEERGRLEDAFAPSGRVTSAELTWAAAERFTGADVFRAAHNSRGHVLFAGTTEGVEALEKRLSADDVQWRRLPHLRPNHTPLMRPAVDGLRRSLRFVTWGEPEIPVISCVDGQRADAASFADPQHWIRHSTEPIRLAEALDHVAATSGPAVFVEVGPPSGLASLADFHFAGDERFAALAALPRDGVDEDAHLLERVGELLQHGIDVKLGRLHSGQTTRRVVLPTYPFRGEEYLLPLPATTPAPPARQARDRWTYRQTWQESRLPAASTAPAGSTAPFASTGPDDDWLLIGSGLEELDLLAAGLPGGLAVLRSSPDEAEVSRVARQWQPSAPQRGLAVCYLDCGSDEPPPARLVGPLLRFIAVYRALVRSLPADKVSLTVATRGVYSTLTGDLAGPAALTTAIVVAAQEQPGLRCRHVDFAAGTFSADVLLDEARSASAEHVVVYRDGRRTVPRHLPEPLPPARDSVPPGADDTILITGGLGSVGFELCRRWGARGARLLIVGRTDLSDTDLSDTGLADSRPADAVARQRLAALQASGIKVSYQRADVTNCEELASAVAAGEAALGPVRGVVHAAARIGGDSFLSFLHDTTPEVLMAQVDVKVTGLALLDEILRDRDVKFRLAFSSNSVLLGGLGYGCYAAANALMGELASHNPRWQVIDWDIWKVGQASGTAIPLGSSASAQPMPLADALACLDDILAGRPRRLLLSTTDLAERATLISRLTGHDAPVKPDLAASATELDAAASAQQVARLAWRRALGGEIDDDSDFVGLGGDSLSAIKVVLEINRRLGSSLSAQDMLRAGSFADFVGRTERNLAASRTDDSAEARPAAASASGESASGESVASVLQERWFDLDARGYGHIDLRVQIAGPLDLELAARAVEHLRRRHAILRSRYDQGSQLVQQPVTDWSPSLLVTDLSGASGEEAATAIRDAEARALRRFDLRAQVPFEVELLRLDPDEHLLIGRMHHIAVDGWSFSLLLEDFERVYACLERGDDPGELPTPPQYGQFAKAQREYVESGAIEPARTAWQRNFSGAIGPTRIAGAESGLHSAGQTDLAGPTDLADPADQEAGRCVNVILDAGTVSGLAEAARASRATVFPLLTTAFALMLRAVTGQDDLIFGTTAAGRHLPGTEEMIGVFVNPLPIRVNLTGKSDVREVLRLVIDQVMDFHQWQNYLLTDLIKHVEPFVGLDINETFHTYILFQNYPRPHCDGPRQYNVLETDDLGDDQIPALLRPHGKLMRDLELIVIERADGQMSLNFWYRQGRFARGQVQQWSDLYASIVQRMVTLR